MSLSEFELIHRYFRDLGTARSDVVLGIGDDGAVTRVPEGHELVTTVDTLVSGVHFDENAAASDIGYKALAVNLSDLAAMGAEPAWATLSLSLPAADETWLQSFADGFGALAGKHQVQLIGGDTVRGPLQVTVQLQGFVPAGAALTRAGARPGDAIFATGTLGDAALALQILESGSTPSESVLGQVNRPVPRVAAGIGLRGLASACIDVSDGLAADLGHMLTAGNVGAKLQLKTVPGSVAIVVVASDDERWRLQLTGGDDYELCFTAPVGTVERIDELARELDLRITRIGTIEKDQGLRLERPDGTLWEMPGGGYEHFSA
jgi:thiamine-monophosphate kinase